MNSAVAAHFEQQATACDAMGSPFTGALCRAAMRVLDDTTQTGRRVLGWPGDPRGDALALRLTGGLHALVLRGMDVDLTAAYPPRGEGVSDTLLSQAIGRHDAFLAGYLESPPQTNETARSAALLPGFLAIARETGVPLALAEIGSSAGLNLFFDRFRYRYGESSWGDPDYPVTLTPQMRGALPDLSGDLRIARRVGCDVAPLDVHDENDRLRLRSYIWPDQQERLARLDAALAVARSGEFSLLKADAGEFVRWQLAARRQGECLVLFHSVVWQYLPVDIQAAIASAMDVAGALATAESPVAWLQLEGFGGVEPHARVMLRLWPGGEERVLAKADFHARWVDWLG